MEEGFKIYIERLRNGVVEAVNESFAPGFLAGKLDEFQFKDPVCVSGEAYIASDQLVLHLTISTTVQLPCRVCNQWAPVDIKVQEMYDGIPIEEIRSGIFCIQGLIRDSLMLQLPEYIECHQGQCPERKEMEKFMREGTGSIADRVDGEDGYQPFKELKF